jgi:hypothetical protein
MVLLVVIVGITIHMPTVIRIIPIPIVMVPILNLAFVSITFHWWTCTHHMHDISHYVIGVARVGSCYDGVWQQSEQETDIDCGGCMYRSYRIVACLVFW